MDIFKHKIIINGKASRLPPGFRFHPDDGELVFEYLAKKIFKRPMFYSLLEIESCNVDPWELLGERDRERYFFVKKKNGEQNGRETSCGYWEESKPEMEIEDSDNNNNYNYPLKGMKKTFVFHLGKKPQGSITQWIIEEFRLVYSKLTRPCCTQHQDKLEEWTAVRVFNNIEDGADEDNMENATFSWSSSSFESINNESDGEEVIQSI